MVLLQYHTIWCPAVPVNLSLKNVPDHVYARLKRRAERHRRSMNSEIIQILDRSLRLDHDQAELLKRIDAVRSKQTFTTSNEEIQAAKVLGRK